MKDTNTPNNFKVTLTSSQSNKKDIKETLSSICQKSQALSAITLVKYKQGNPTKVYTIYWNFPFDWNWSVCDVNLVNDDAIKNMDVKISVKYSSNSELPMVHLTEIFQHFE